MSPEPMPPLLATPPKPAVTTTNVAPPLTGRVYISTQGDWWDLIAINVYGRRRGNEHLMFRLLEANYHLRNVSQFPAGVAVIVPEVDVVTTIPLVPWKTATVNPNT
jgi:phage tail protein X